MPPERCLYPGHGHLRPQVKAPFTRQLPTRRRTNGSERPNIPRKSTTLRSTRRSLANVADQIGVLVAIERNRQGLTQWELAVAADIGQNDVSHIETGKPGKHRRRQR